MDIYVTIFVLCIIILFKNYFRAKAFSTLTQNPSRGYNLFIFCSSQFLKSMKQFQIHIKNLKTIITSLLKSNLKNILCTHMYFVTTHANDIYSIDSKPSCMQVFKSVFIVSLLLISLGIYLYLNFFLPDLIVIWVTFKYIFVKLSTFIYYIQVCIL